MGLPDLMAWSGTVSSQLTELDPPIHGSVQLKVYISTGEVQICSADMGSKQTRSNTHEHRVLVDTDLQRVTWKEEAPNPKPQTSLCPDTKAGNFEGMRTSSPTHATGERAPPPSLVLGTFLPALLNHHYVLF
jgi:hypothetical protein